VLIQWVKHNKHIKEIENLCKKLVSFKEYQILEDSLRVVVEGVMLKKGKLLI